MSKKPRFTISRVSLHNGIIWGLFVLIIFVMGSNLYYPDKTEKQLEITVSITAVLVSVAIAKITIHYHDRNLKTQALLKVFDMLSTEDSRKERREIFAKYWEIYPERRENAKVVGKMKFSEKDPFKVHVERVTSAFDKVGVMVNERLIDRKLFFDLYGGMVARTYEALKEDITTDQQVNPERCKWFTYLNKEMENYYQRKGEKPPPIYVNQKEE